MKYTQETSWVEYGRCWVWEMDIVKMKIEDGALSFIYKDKDLGIAYKDWRLMEQNLYAFAWLGDPGD